MTTILLREERWIKNREKRRNTRRELADIPQWQAEGEFILQVFNLRTLAGLYICLNCDARNGNGY